MRPKLTERQNQIYETVRAFIRQNGKPPTIKEIQAEIGVRSTGGVHKTLGVLERKGYIARTPHEARSITVLDDVGRADEEAPGVLMLRLDGRGRRARPLTSETAAFPLPRSRRVLLVDPSLVPDDVDLDDCLGVVAGDDGMSGVGISKGDRVVVEEGRWQDLHNGDLVAALFYDKVVVRQFAFADRRLAFRAADRHHSDESARPDDVDYFVIGRALAVMRPLVG